MATYKGTNKTIADAPSPATIISKGEVGGNVRVMFDTYVVPTAPLATTTDVIEMCGEIPTGAKVLEVTVYNGCGTRAISVGDYEDTTRYNASVATTATERIDTAGVAIGYEVDMTTAATPDNQIIITPIAGALTAAEVISIVVLYVAE